MHEDIRIQREGHQVLAQEESEGAGPRQDGFILALMRKAGLPRSVVDGHLYISVWLDAQSSVMNS